MKDLYIIILIIVIIGLIYYIHIKEKNKKNNQDDNNNKLSVNTINIIPENNIVPIVSNPDIVLDYPIDDTYFGGWIGNRYPFFRHYHRNYNHHNHHNHHRPHDDHKHLDFRMPSKQIINRSHRR
jgi:hypothetical protein